jgi:hypothetical protein
MKASSMRSMLTSTSKKYSCELVVVSIGRALRCWMGRPFFIGKKGDLVMTGDIVWKCEQWFGGHLQERKVFRSEEDAREFARKLSGVAPDLMLKIEAMPIQHVWN